MDHLARRDLRFDGIEEADELLVPVALQAPSLIAHLPRPHPAARPRGPTGTPRASLRQTRGAHSATRGSSLWTPWATRCSTAGVGPDWTLIPGPDSALVDTRLVHVSGIGADPQSCFPHICSRSHGERLVVAAFPHATVVRPSVLIGPGDALFGRLSSLIPLLSALSHDG